jgi:hypothetical protein
MKIKIYSAVPKIVKEDEDVGGVYSATRSSEKETIMSREHDRAFGRLSERTPLDLAVARTYRSYWAVNTMQGLYLQDTTDKSIFCSYEGRKAPDEEMLGGQICFFQYSPEEYSTHSAFYIATTYYEKEGDTMATLGVLKATIGTSQKEDVRSLEPVQELSFLKPNGVIAASDTRMAICEIDGLTHWNGHRVTTAKTKSGYKVSINKPEYKHRGNVNNQVVSLALNEKYTVIGTNHGRIHLFKDHGNLEYFLEYTTPSRWKDFGKEGNMDFLNGLPTIPDSLCFVDYLERTYLLVGMDLGNLFVYQVIDSDEGASLKLVNELTIIDPELAGQSTIKKIKEVNTLSKNGRKQQLVFFSYRRKIWEVKLDDIIIADSGADISQFNSAKSYSLKHRSFGFDVVEVDE